MRRHVAAILAATLLLGVGRAAADRVDLAPGPIPDAGTLERAGEIGAGPARTVVGLRVRLVASHPWVGDLRATLVAPDGATVALIDRPGVPSAGYPGPWGCGGDDLDLVLDDAGTAPAESTCPYGATPALSGTLRPLEPLATLRGRSPAGIWRVRIEDLVPGDSGALLAGSIEIATAPDCNRNGVDDAIDLANGTSADSDLDGVPDECACAADLDGNGAVDAGDLAAILAAWGPCRRCGADLDASGAVDASDLAAVLAAWGTCGAS